MGSPPFGWPRNSPALIGAGARALKARAREMMVASRGAGAMGAASAPMPEAGRPRRFASARRAGPASPMWPRAAASVGSLHRACRGATVEWTAGRGRQASPRPAERPHAPGDEPFGRQAVFPSNSVRSRPGSTVEAASILPRSPARPCFAWHPGLCGSTGGSATAKRWQRPRPGGRAHALSVVPREVANRGRHGSSPLPRRDRGRRDSACDHLPYPCGPAQAAFDPPSQRGDLEAVLR